MRAPPRRRRARCRLARWARRRGRQALRVREEHERGLHPAAHVARAGEVELHEDGVDVLLDGALREDERLGDRLVALALRDLGERLELARRERGERRVRYALAAADEKLDDLRIDVGPSAVDRPYRVDELSAMVHPLLEQVGAPGRAGLEQLEDVARLGV